MRAGLEDLSVSRLRTKVSWAVPAPSDPARHSVYVWLDALAVYLSGAVAAAAAASGNRRTGDSTAAAAATVLQGGGSDSEGDRLLLDLAAAVGEKEKESAAGAGADARSGGVSFLGVWPPAVQFVGKDILRFHAVFWPAFLLAVRYTRVGWI